MDSKTSLKRLLYCSLTSFVLSYGAMAQTPSAPYSFQDGQKFVKTYCAGCHIGRAPAGGFNVAPLNTDESFNTAPEAWHSLIARVRNGEMPPKNAPAPHIDKREAFVEWVQERLRTQAC